MPFKKGKSKSVAVRALTKVNKLQRQFKPEVKSKLENSVGLGVPLTGQVITFTNIAESVTSLGRTGLAVSGKSLSIKYNLTKNISPATSFARILIFRDKQQIQDTNPSASDVLQSTASNTAIISFPSEVFLKRFDIMYDRTHLLTSQQPVSSGVKHFNLKNLDIRYNGSTSSDIQKNGLYMMFIGDEISTVPLMNLSSRFRYTDL